MRNNFDFAESLNRTVGVDENRMFINLGFGISLVPKLSEEAFNGFIQNTFGVSVACPLRENAYAE